MTDEFLVNNEYEDGSIKLFLNMSSQNGRPELVSLLQYMKHTRLDNPAIIVQDERIVKLDKVVEEVKQSEEREAVKMTFLNTGRNRLEQYRNEFFKI
ncbi:MAG: hypothetical protein ACI4EJ_08040 [Bacteroides sp.]